MMMLPVWYYKCSNQKKNELHFFSTSYLKKCPHVNSPLGHIISTLGELVFVLSIPCTLRGELTNTYFTVKPVHVVTFIKQSPVLKGHLFLVVIENFT